jgi:hypothetical protein
MQFFYYYPQILQIIIMLKLIYQFYLFLYNVAYSVLQLLDICNYNKIRGKLCMLINNRLFNLRAIYIQH